MQKALSYNSKFKRLSAGYAHSTFGFTLRPGVYGTCNFTRLSARYAHSGSGSNFQFGVCGKHDLSHVEVGISQTRSCLGMARGTPRKPPYLMRVVWNDFWRP